MAKRKARRQRFRQRSTAVLQNGLGAFRNGDYDKAIEVWERVAPQSPQMQPTSALAQVYFRRGLERTYGQQSDPVAGLGDLSQAAELQPDDPCYAYHLGLAAHRLGALDRAVHAYRAARKDGGEFANRAACPLALALQQQGQEPSDDPVWSALAAEERAMLRQAHAFRRRPYTLSSDAPALWRGLVALDAGDHERARALLEDALQRTTGPAEEGTARYYLGALAAQAEDWDAARHHWNAACASGLALPRLESNVGEAYHRLAEERMGNGDAEGALAAAVEALRHEPDDKRLAELLSQAHQRLAYEAASAGRWVDATQHWEAANRAEGGGFRLAYNLALAYERAEEFATAGEKWREALRRRPRRDDHPDAINDEQVSQLWRRAAEAYSKAGEYDEAVRVYRQAVKWNPDHIDTRMALSEMLLANGQLQAAENELGRILERDPDNIPALLRRGEVIAASGSWWWGDSPVSCWERVLKLEPDNPTARQLLADFYQDQADYHLSWADHARAVEMYQKALAYQPKSGRILAALGGCHLRMNEKAVAQSYIEQALSSAPGDLGVYDLIIHAWLDVDQPDRAWEVMGKAEAAVETIPCEFYVHQAYHRIHRSDLARPWLERAVEKATSDEPVFMIIGEMAVTTRAWQIAREYLERALAAGQEGGQAHLMLGIVEAQEGNLGAAEKHWGEAERIARREHDSELLERVQMTRLLFRGPSGLAGLLMGLGMGGGPFGPSLADLFGDDEDDDFFGEDDEDDDDLWY